MGRLDERAQAWVEAAVGVGARVVLARKLPGATSSDVRAVDVELPSGGRHKLVLRRHTNADWLEREPDLASREATALDMLATAALPSPELVAVDADGWACGEPAVLMTRLAGTHRWVPPSVERLAEVGQTIHSIPAPAGYRTYRRYHPHQEPPAWSSQPERWQKALEVAAAADPSAAETGFIHRDHHAGNVLWARGRVTGVVDWIEACVGPLAVDVARCRWNLWRSDGPASAARYGHCAGVVVDPVWDVVDGCDSIGDGLLAGPHAEALEGFVFAALAELG